MNDKYIPKNFETETAKKWDKEQVYKTDLSKEKKYILDMFPYPSGDGLHVGHVRIYTASDILARYFRMKGFGVFHPMGWDAFCLPAENAAIKMKKNPMDIVPQNIANFKRQMKMLGFSYDWDNELSTTDPKYYKWTQWLFIQFFNAGLLYKKLTPVYYCMNCRTGLAEEEVLSDGTHERCGYEITRKTLPQWIFKITKYADKLLESIDHLDWPDGIKKMQRYWIGKSEGINIKFKINTDQIGVKNKKFTPQSWVKSITVFTTRPDTVFGATALIIAPEHKLVSEILNNKSLTNVDKNLIKKYVDDAKKKADLARSDLEKDKSGIFTGLYSINPVNNKKIPVYIADYVIGWYGHAAVMLVPDCDKRDFKFAKKHNLEIIKVINRENYNEAFTENGEIIVTDEIKNFFSNDKLFKKPINSTEFKKLISKKLEEKGIGKISFQYKIRDWIFSRQRYWGEPIPMVFCESCASRKILYKGLSKGSENIENLCGWFPVSEQELPIKLPHVESYKPGMLGESPLSKIKDWVNTICPNCKSEAVRETDTMPNWAGSCWYFIRFTDCKNENKAWDEKKAEKLLPVDWYLGGAEHAVLHLLYSRFWVKALKDINLLKIDEPFTKLNNVGMVLAEDKRKMSKSFGNIINPDEVVHDFGADTLRVYEMFMAPFSQEVAWSTKNVQGSYRFLKKIWHLILNDDKQTDDEKKENKIVLSKLNETILKVGQNIEDIKFNTAISFMMEFINTWESNGKLSKENIKKFLIILSPFAPFITDELWQKQFNEKKSIHLEKWPSV